MSSDIIKRAKKALEEIPSRSADALKSILIRRICSASGLSPRMIEKETPTLDPLMNLCLMESHVPHGVMFATYHLEKPASIWNFIARGNQPTRDSGFAALESGFRSAAMEYQSYGHDMTSVAMVFRLGKNFVYTSSEFIAELGSDYSFFKFPGSKDSESQWTDGTDGRMIFSLDCLFPKDEDLDE